MNSSSWASFMIHFRTISSSRADPRKAKDVLRAGPWQGPGVGTHRAAQGGAEGPAEGQARVRWVCWKAGGSEVGNPGTRSWGRKEETLACVQIDFTAMRWASPSPNYAGSRAVEVNGKSPCSETSKSSKTESPVHSAERRHLMITDDRTQRKNKLKVCWK